MQRPRRCLAREIGNPLTMFHGPANGREKKWSWFRVSLFGLWLGFLTHWPTEWNAWSFAFGATLALSTTVDTLFAQAPVSEGLAALAAIFGATVAKRMSTSTTTSTVETSGPGPLEPKVAEDQPNEWADGDPHAGLG